MMRHLRGPLIVSVFIATSTIPAAFTVLTSMMISISSSSSTTATTATRSIIVFFTIVNNIPFFILFLLLVIIILLLIIIVIATITGVLLQSRRSSPSTNAATPPPPPSLQVDKGSQALADGLAKVEDAIVAAKAATNKEVSDLAQELAGGASVSSEKKPSNPEEDTVIGIDLGTTFSCCAVWRHGEPEVLANSEGERTTPSWVAFAEDGTRLIGDAAKRQAAMNTKNTLFNMKRLIGRQYGECYDEIKIMPFDVKEGPGGKPMVNVAGKTLRPSRSAPWCSRR